MSELAKQSKAIHAVDCPKCGVVKGVLCVFKYRNETHTRLSPHYTRVLAMHNQERKTDVNK